MREAVNSMAASSKSAIFALALVAGLGMGIGISIVVESRSVLFPYKPTPDLCKAFGHLKSD